MQLKNKTMMERFFNTAGPNRPDEQYTIDPLSRFDLADVMMLIRQKKYFVIWHKQCEHNGRTIMIWGM